MAQRKVHRYFHPIFGLSASQTNLSRQWLARIRPEKRTAHPSDQTGNRREINVNFIGERLV
jgi:hypothetical protein